MPLCGTFLVKRRILNETISIGYAVMFILILKNSEYGTGAEGYEIMATYIGRMIGIINKTGAIGCNYSKL